MCIPPVLVRAIHEVGVTSLMRRIPKPCKWRFIVYEGDCAVNDEDELLPILTSLLMNIEMAVTGPSQGLLPVSLSCVMRTTTMNAEVRAHLSKAWETMLRAKR